MRIAIFGAGAIGGLIAARVCAAQAAEITVIARGPHLQAMRERGLTVRASGETTTVHPRCAGNAAEAGPQDYVVVTLKAHGLHAAAANIAHMFGPETALVTGINGIPYWYFYGLEGPWRDRRVRSVDPEGTLWDILPPSRVIHAIVYPAAEVVEPGTVEHTYGDRFSLGEPDGTRSARAEALSKVLIASGLKAPVRPRIREEIWIKLWGNMAFNPLSALTSATLDVITGRPDLRSVCRGMMLEGQAIAEALGIRFAIDVDKRIDGAAEVGHHKTSMLQDLERGRPMEIDALLGAVVELGEVVGVTTPLSSAVLALVRERARQAGCYG